MQDHLFRSYSSHFPEYRALRTMKWTFGVIQWPFQFTWPDDVDAQISYLVDPGKILVIYGNITTFNIMTRGLWCLMRLSRILQHGAWRSQFSSGAKWPRGRNFGFGLGLGLKPLASASALASNICPWSAADEPAARKRRTNLFADYRTSHNAEGKRTDDRR